MGFKQSQLGLVAILCAIFLLPAEAGNLYRYRNVEGVLVVDWTVPAEYTRHGYEVLNDDGIVVEVVPRELTAEERKDRALSQRIADRAKAEEERLRLWDETLLRRYSAVEDVESARDRSLRELKIRISILKSNRRSLRQKVENYQANIADAERDGVTPSEADLEAIEILKREIIGTKKAIDDRQIEVDRVFAEYALDIERLRQLQDVILLRQNLALPASDE